MINLVQSMLSNIAGSLRLPYCVVHHRQRPMMQLIYKLKAESCRRHPKEARLIFLPRYKSGLIFLLPTTQSRLKPNVTRILDTVFAWKCILNPSLHCTMVLYTYQQPLKGVSCFFLPHYTMPSPTASSTR